MSLPTFLLARDRSDTPSDPMDHRRLAYYPPAIPGAGGIHHQCGHFFNLAPWE